MEICFAPIKIKGRLIKTINNDNSMCVVKFASKDKPIAPPSKNY
jgi:hypothetical protein